MPSEIFEDENGIVTTKGLPGKCPACGAKLDAATSPDGRATPVPGDVSICIKCATVLEFDDSLSVILLTEETRSELPEEVWAEITSMRFMVASLNAGGKSAIH